MSNLVQSLWLIPVLPLVAAGVLALTPQRHRQFASSLAIGALSISFVLALFAFVQTLSVTETLYRATFNFDWFRYGDTSLKLGLILDPLTAAMLVMVTFVGTLIFIFSTGYMAEDENYTRFFCFLSLFAAAMLGLVLANNLLLLFICWELVGVASYLLIGFWYTKPSAASAAKKAFITTRIGDIGFFLGILWLYSQTGTLLFYDKGQGCLEETALTKLVSQLTIGGMAVSTAISLLIFCGAIGKSGQVPLHVWLPDAMEGPTPVSALIHAATMVAAGVFLMARMYPLLSAGVAPGQEGQVTPALQVVTWVGAITAVFAALIAVAQTDIKRILAYSTVSQLGYMFMGLGVGGVGVAMFHLITHAFFKALLFLGAGSVIHGCHHQQDIRYLGGLRKLMPVTFATYAIGMMALAGVPLFFSGFWSKDEILHAASHWTPSRWPFYLGIIGALLTAFYMTRQMCYVFFGKYRGDAHYPPHESPHSMTIPLAILAVFAVALGFIGTPAWPWFESYLNGHLAHLHPSKTLPLETVVTMLVSTAVVALGIGLGWWLYGSRFPELPQEIDPLQRAEPDLFAVLRGRFFVDELYAATIFPMVRFLGRTARWLDEIVWSGLVALVTYIVIGLAWADKLIDEFLVNLGFDVGCGTVRKTGRWISLFQNGQVQRYLRVVGLAIAVLALFLIWGCK